MFEILNQVNQEIINKAKNIQLLILDVDGVLTTGQLFISPNGEILKPFNTLDGHGIKLLQQSGVQTAIITARSDKAVQFRAEQLGITHYIYGVEDKKTAYLNLINQLNLQQNQCAMIGDDVIDLPILINCGLAISVANAHDFVKQHTDYTTQKLGGMGAVREATDLIMFSQNTLESALNFYLK